MSNQKFTIINDHQYLTVLRELAYGELDGKEKLSKRVALDEYEILQKDHLRVGKWMATTDGRRLWPFDIRPGELSIEHSAYILARINRFNGAIYPSNYPYAVAQHAIAVSYMVPKRLALPALVHDNDESVTGDQITPIKHFLKNSEFRQIGENISSCVHSELDLNISEEDAMLIKHADNLALYFEVKHRYAAISINGYPEIPASVRRKVNDKSGIGEDVIMSLWDFDTTEKMYLKRFKELSRGKKSNKRKQV